MYQTYITLSVYGIQLNKTTIHSILLLPFFACVFLFLFFFGHFIVCPLQLFHWMPRDLIKIIRKLHHLLKIIKSVSRIQLADSSILNNKTTRWHINPHLTNVVECKSLGYLMILSLLNRLAIFQAIFKDSKIKKHKLFNKFQVLNQN